MTQKQLDAILVKHNVPNDDRLAFRDLCEFGIRPSADYRAKLRRGRLRKAFDEVLLTLTEETGPKRWPRRLHSA